MSNSAFDDCVAFSLNIEQGYQNLADDAGNWTGGKVGVGHNAGTMRGITPCLYALDQDIAPADVTAEMMKAITAAQATSIYGRRFWNPIQGDQLPGGINLSTFDMEVNGGRGGAVSLQRAIGMPEAQCDGWIGQQTLAALAKVDSFSIAKSVSIIGARSMQQALGVEADGDVGRNTLNALAGVIGPGGSAAAVAVAAKLYDTQMNWYRSCGNWARFQRTWTSRCLTRVNAATKAAVAWRAQPTEALA